jgi:hypothetical protein
MTNLGRLFIRTLAPRTQETAAAARVKSSKHEEHMDADKQTKALFVKVQIGNISQNL